MKKLISLLLIISLCASAAGCAAVGKQTSEQQPPVIIDYDSAVVSYLGPEGTYTQEAGGKFFEGRGTYIPYKTVGDAVDALISHDSSYAVIPQENTIGGAVVDYMRIKMFQLSGRSN